MHSTKAPSTRIRFCSKTENLSFGLSYAHTCLVKTITEYASFRKRSLEWRFLKTLPSRRRVGGQKRVFSNTMMSKIIPFSIVQRFDVDERKRFERATFGRVLFRKRTFFVFKNIRIRVDGAQNMWESCP